MPALLLCCSAALLLCCLGALVPWCLDVLVSCQYLTCRTVLVSVCLSFSDVVGWALGWSSALVTCLLWLLVVAAAWLWYRPLYGAGLLVAAGALLWYLSVQHSNLH